MFRNKEIDEIRRREPTKSDINNPQIWILDVGDTHDPSLNCFDHHQEPMDDCTLSLLLKEWGMWKKATRVYTWLEVSVMRDAIGPEEVSKFLNIKPHLIARLDSFIQRTLLHFYEEEEVINERNIIFPLMRSIGKHFFVNIRDYFKFQEKIEKKIEFERIKDVLVTSCYKNMKHSDQIARILKEKRGAKYPNESGGIFIYPSRRKPDSLVLKRFKDDPRVDFSKLSNCKDTIYAHPQGYIARIHRISEEEITKYLEKAIE